MERPMARSCSNVEDPADNFAYEVHQYFNADWTGTSADCQSVDIGISTLTPVTEWARTASASASSSGKLALVRVVPASRSGSRYALHERE